MSFKNNENQKEIILLIGFHYGNHKKNKGLVLEYDFLWHEEATVTAKNWYRRHRGSSFAYLYDYFFEQRNELFFNDFRNAYCFWKCTNALTVAFPCSWILSENFWNFESEIFGLIVMLSSKCPEESFWGKKCIKKSFNTFAPTLSQVLGTLSKNVSPRLPNFRTTCLKELFPTKNFVERDHVRAQLANGGEKKIYQLTECFSFRQTI